jgi:hypothetical protein
MNCRAASPASRTHSPVPAQREMGIERFPLVSIPPFGRGFSRHGGLSIRWGLGQGGDLWGPHSCPRGLLVLSDGVSAWAPCRGQRSGARRRMEPARRQPMMVSGLKKPGSPSKGAEAAQGSPVRLVQPTPPATGSLLGFRSTTRCRMAGASEAVSLRLRKVLRMGARN